MGYFGSKHHFFIAYSNQIVFKGGTSLSKAWDLIARFSEDIDLAINRELLGFGGDLSNSQIRKLRKASCTFIGTTFHQDIQAKLIELGVEDYELVAQATTDTDKDPLTIELNYKSLTSPSEYIRPRVLIEIGARSLVEPIDEKEIISIVSKEFNTLPFVESEITIPVVSPKRTFLEKIFLLHEEFQKEANFIRTERMSRHLYDLEKLMDTTHGTEALKDANLYNTIVEHRRKFNALKGINYDNHRPTLINILLPKDVVQNWKTDYETMQENMIYGETIRFDQLMLRISALNTRVNKLGASY